MRGVRYHVLSVSITFHLFVLFGLSFVILPRRIDRIIFGARQAPETAGDTELESVVIRAAEPRLGEACDKCVDLAIPKSDSVMDVSKEWDRVNAMSTISDGDFDTDLLQSKNWMRKTKEEHLLTRSARGSMEPLYGIVGTGQRVIFIVDASKSMGPRFLQVKRNLQRAMMSLSTEQSILVIFYDEDLRFSSERRSGRVPLFLKATPANVKRIGDWMASIETRMGSSPAAAFDCAFRVKPDVVYLVSDGAFSSHIVDRIREANWSRDGFGELSRCSVVHTIGYDRQGQEDPLRRIAQENGGQFATLDNGRYGD